MTAFKKITAICAVLCLAALLIVWKFTQGGRLFPGGAGSHDIYPSILIESSFDWNCENSGQGKLVISDSKGFICDRHQVNLSSGCCNTGFDLVSEQQLEKGFVNNGTVFRHHQRSKKRFECSKCKPDSGCCLDFESCISCCLKPSNLQKYLGLYLALGILKRSAAGNESSNVMHSQFAYCKHVCRTNSLSLQAENSYRGFHNNCFGLNAAPIEKIPINSDFAGVPDLSKLEINEVKN